VGEQESKVESIQFTQSTNSLYIVRFCFVSGILQMHWDRSTQSNWTPVPRVRHTIDRIVPGHSAALRPQAIRNTIKRSETRLECTHIFQQGSLQFYTPHCLDLRLLQSCPVTRHCFKCGKLSLYLSAMSGTRIWCLNKQLHKNI